MKSLTKLNFINEDDSKNSNINELQINEVKKIKELILRKKQNIKKTTAKHEQTAFNRFRNIKNDDKNF